MSRLIMSTAMLSLVVVLLASVATIAEAQQTTDDPSSSNQSGAGENPDQPDQSGQSGDSVAEDAEPGDETAAEPRIIRAKDKNHPFQVRIGAPDFPRDAEWLNTGGPIRMKDLKGKFVILDFWTYCCINCIHILPELKKLEHKYPKNLVVIGVHSAKFDTEKGAKNISEAVLRYEIEHPVVNDPEHRIWNSFGVSSWPSIVLIDPEGNFVGRNSGEFKAEDISPLLDRAITYYRKNDLLDESAVHFDQLAAKQPATPLRFPGKVLADESGDRLFISDSNHNRIVITSLSGKLLDIIGAGSIGAADGSFAKATFDHPQGMALVDDTLYIADTENHLLRKVDLKKKTVSTIAGDGKQSRAAWPGMARAATTGKIPERWVGKPSDTGLNSPWDLLAHDGNLYIAMAGPHQIWRMTLDEKEIGPYAGNGREDIVDGLLLPKQPYTQSLPSKTGKPLPYSAFAQPSGLATDGKRMFVADSEGSSVRVVPFDAKGSVTTLVGSAHLPYGRLFEFGFIDGEPKEARLQHVLGVAYHDGFVYAADTYNNAIRAINAETGETTTLAGVKAVDKKTDQTVGVPGFDDEAGTFDEPTGISYAAGKLFVADTNNHAIRTIDLKTKQVSTLAIADLKPPAKPKIKRPTLPPGAETVELKASPVRLADGSVNLTAKLKFPAGWKINPLAPMSYYVEETGESGVIAEAALSKATKLAKPSATFNITLPAEKVGKVSLDVLLTYYYCQDGGEGVCKIGGVKWNIPLEVSASSDAPPTVELPLTVKP